VCARFCAHNNARLLRLPTLQITPVALVACVTHVSYALFSLYPRGCHKVSCLRFIKGT
jgi:hypothetical protein